MARKSTTEFIYGYIPPRYKFKKLRNDYIKEQNEIAKKYGYVPKNGR